MQALLNERGAEAMPHPGGITPGQWDLAGKISAALVTIGGILAALWKGATALLDSRIQSVYLQARKDEQEGLLAIRAAVDGLDEWSKTHTLDDRHEFGSLKTGQSQTHETLDKMQSTLTTLNEKLDKTQNEISRVHGQLDVMLRRRDREQ